MSTILSFSLTKEEAEKIDLLAKEQNRSRSQVIKDALKHYEFSLRWQELRRTGDLISKRLGLESDDDVELAFK